jgi:hypothetical protein
MIIWLLGATALIVAAAGGFVWLLRKRRSKQTRPANSALDALDTVAAWEPQATRIMTSAERLAYATLLRATPEHLVLVQVPLSRFLRVPTRYSYTEWLARVGQLCADLVVCDSSSQVLAVVEVRPAKQSDRSRKRFDRMSRVLKAAGVPLHVWTEEALPSVPAAREMVLRDPQAKDGKDKKDQKEPMESAPARVTQPAPLLDIVPAPAPAAHTGPSPSLLAAHGLAGGVKDNLGANGSHAPGFELRDPPPSTWFDDLDVRPAPKKH